MFVFIDPGENEKTLILSDFTSSKRERDNPKTPCFDVQYAIEFLNPEYEEEEPILTILPHLLFFISPMKFFASKNGALTLTLKISSNSFNVVLSIDFEEKVEFVLSKFINLIGEKCPEESHPSIKKDLK